MATVQVGSGSAPARHDPQAEWHKAEVRSDLVRLGLAAGLFVLTLLAIQRDHLSMLERDVFRLINDLPPWLLPPLEVVMQFGTRFAPIVIGAVVILALRRVRLGVSIMVAGEGAWLVAQALKQLVERARPAEFLGHLDHALSSGGPGFVSGHTAVATAMAAAAAPYLSRPWRRTLWAVVFAVGFARIYVGVHLPLDVVGGFAIGWFVGTLVHLLIGTPPARRTPADVKDLLIGLGLDVRTVEPTTVYAKASHPFRVTTGRGDRLFVKVLDPDPRSSDWLLRLGRVLASGERSDVSAMDSLSEAADHEAAAAMAARNAGVQVPAVVLARGDSSMGVVVLEDVGGHDLSETPPDALTDDVLEQVWRQVALLHRAHIAHRDLVRGNVVLDPAGNPWLVDFRDARVGASPTSMEGDVAELVTSLAVAVGPERAVKSAMAVLGRDTLERALPRLELFSLSPRTRVELKDRPGLLDAVRATSGGGPGATTDLLNLHRLWLPALVAAAGYAVMISIVGWSEIVAALGDTVWRWAVLCGVVFAAAPLFFGYALTLASPRRLAVGRSAAAGAVARSIEVIAGPSARRHHLERYIRSCGAQPDDAGAAADLAMTSEVVADAIAVVSGIGLALWQGYRGPDLSHPVPAFLAVALVAGVAGWLVRRSVRGSWPHTSWMRAASESFARARAAPARALGVLAAALAAEVALVVALAAALRAVGPTASIAAVAIALASGRALAAVLGIAGLPVVIEALVVAVLCALGIPAAAAVVAALVYALFRYWISGAINTYLAPKLARPG